MDEWMNEWKTQKEIGLNIFYLLFRVQFLPFSSSVSWKANLYEPHQYLSARLDSANREKLREREESVGMASTWLHPSPDGLCKGPLYFQGRVSAPFLHDFWGNDTFSYLFMSLSLVVSLYLPYTFGGSPSINLFSTEVCRCVSCQGLEKYRRARTKLRKALHACKKLTPYSFGNGELGQIELYARVWHNPKGEANTRGQCRACSPNFWESIPHHWKMLDHVLLIYAHLFICKLYTCTLVPITCV